MGSRPMSALQIIILLLGSCSIVQTIVIAILQHDVDVLKGSDQIHQNKGPRS